ncbi:general secretion pathway protein GspB [Vibrio sp. S17_S38]|uniref:general secretion pathway protein GspB n=1 Tax=Vibrio sp. S17_S38 TaxID=2720229 RepID=UPI001681403C|nr:general secretion pathway protein GspB [Vibrio sp. S17_S38]MBD1572724.1 general secretion pathway protein GspB [Vibrio sp. S17_S38]
MSEVMKALQQSEQAYRSQLSPKSEGSYRYLAIEKTPHKWLVVSLFILPFLLVLLFLLVYPLVQSPKTIEDISSSKNINHKQNLQVHLLPFPKMKDLQVLPEVKFQPKVVDNIQAKALSVKTQAAKTEPQGRVIKTTQINASSEKNQAWNVDNIDMSGVSPDIVARFKQAMLTESQLDPQPRSKVVAPKSEPLKNPSFDAPMINLVGNEKIYQGRLPKMNFETHMYSSKLTSRWIKVNGSNVHEGEWIVDKLVKLEKILPGSLVVRFDGQNVQIPALYEWAG